MRCTFGGKMLCRESRNARASCLNVCHFKRRRTTFIFFRFISLSAERTNSRLSCRTSKLDTRLWTATKRQRNCPFDLAGRGPPATLGVAEKGRRARWDMQTTHILSFVVVRYALARERALDMLILSKDVLELCRVIRRVES